MKKTTYFIISFLLVLFSTNLEAQTSCIDFASPRQTISGFGGMNMPSWISDLTAGQAEKAFGTDTGQIGLSILRIKVPMNSNSWYRELPTSRRAKNMGAMILASPWSPPAYMKTNNNGTGGELRSEYYGDFADHLADFFDYMSANGAALDVISIQNEPDIEVNYESCDWTPTQMRNFLENYASVIPAKVLVSESYNFDRSETDPILNDPNAEVQVDIIGGHLYGGGLYSYPLAMSKGKEVWMTEYLDTDTDWASVLATGKQIHDCMVSDFNAYIWWYIRRFYGPIDDSGNVTKRGYVMSHFARFIRPGYTRVNADATPALGVFVSAYRNSDTAVIVAINQNASATDITFSFSGGTVAGFDRYETTSSSNAELKDSVAAGNSLMVSLPASSITTFVGTLESTYTNPVLPGDHPDLTLLKHGDDFYAGTSSFHFTPYCAIMHSTDLVHWEVISRAVGPDWSGLNSDAPSDGIWQGVITYFYDSFWLYFSNNAGGGQYFCKADSPEGPWSEPTKMRVTSSTGASGYDNSIFVDDDGTPYMLIKPGRYINRIQEIGPDGHLIGTVINMDWVNADGQYSWAEGPVMCKRDGWYYYFIAGNVSGGQWVLRSQTLTGDPSSWEELGAFFAPITDPDTGFRGPNHITAPVQIQDGTWWTLSHSYERVGSDDWNGLGRQGLLHQVTWDANGIPTGAAPTAPPVAGPNLPSSGIPVKTTLSDEFTDSNLNLAWHFLNTAAATKYSLTEKPGWMWLIPGGARCHLLQKEAEHSYHLVTKVSLDATSSGQEGGIYITNGDESLVVKLCSGYSNGKKIIFSFDNTSYQVNNDVGNTVWLRIERSNHILYGYYSANGLSWNQVGSGISVVDLDKGQPNYNAWVGNSHGLYAQEKDADFDFFYYNYYDDSDDSNSGIWLEAECGNVGSLWNVPQSSTASNDAYVTIQPGNNSTGDPPSGSNGQITYTFDVNESGQYVLWARVICPSPNDDSFWIKMDNEAWIMWNNIPYARAWSWASLAQPFSLSPGNHTLTIAYREDGTQLDKLALSMTGSTPTGYGGDTSNCR